MGSKRKRPEADAAASLTFPLQPCSIRGMLARTAWLGVEVHRGGCFAIQGGKQKEEEEERGGAFSARHRGLPPKRGKSPPPPLSPSHTTIPPPQLKREPSDQSDSPPPPFSSCGGKMARDECERPRRPPSIPPFPFHPHSNLQSQRGRGISADILRGG